MALEDLMNDTVVVQSPSVAVGATMGAEESYSDGVSLDCCVQDLKAHEALEYSARGSRVTHAVYFDADPGITNANRLKLPDGTLLRIEAIMKEGRPGETLLWTAICESVTTRLDQA